MITNIPIEKLHPHPDNPRKGLGDLTELAESIKAKGVLQNLTVIPQKPGYCPSCSLYVPSVGKCQKGHDASERPPCSKWESAGSFTVIIGHRRLAAAKKAGLTELPCVITEMSDKDQVATMLLENIQRSDLTVYEQARGFQMMMNLGENIASISEKTGFSESTVRRRVSLLELDAEKFKKSVDRGATLMDFAKLEEIKDITKRNEVLDAFGTQNFAYKLKSALDAEKMEVNRALWIEALNQFAEEMPHDGASFRHVAYYNLSDTPEKVLKVPDDAQSVKHYYRLSSYGITIVKEGASHEAEQEAQRLYDAMKERDAGLRNLGKRAFELRRDFVLNFSAAKKHLPIIIRFWLRGKMPRAGGYEGFHDDMFAQAMGIVDDNGDYELTYSAIESQVQATPEKVFLLAAYCDLEDDARERYHNTGWHAWPEYADNERLDAIYEGLEELGYKVSDEERRWMTGEHELFTPPAEDASDQSEPTGTDE